MEGRLCRSRSSGRVLTARPRTDEANRAAVAAVGAEKLALVGLGLYGPKNPVDKALKCARMHA